MPRLTLIPLIHRSNKALEVRDGVMLLPVATQPTTHRACAALWRL